jgi:aminoglycoside 3-N-acetyltransferase
MFTKKQLFSQLEEMNAPRTSVVMVHSSLKAVGETEDRGEGLLDVLIDYFTSLGGLLCFPTHTWAYIGKSPVLDMTVPRTCVGKLTELAAAHKDSLRSLHPTHSVAVFGERKRAEEYIYYDSIACTPAHPNGSFGKLFAENGYVFLVGVGHNKNTYIHSVEEMLDVENRLTENKVALDVILPDGSKVTRYSHCHHAQDIGDVSSHYPNYEPAFRHFGHIKDGFLGNAKTQLCSAVGMKETVELIRKNSGGIELLADDTPINEIYYK